MSENEQIDALLGARKADPAAGGEDWKAKAEKLQRELDSARVEHGRVAKLDAEKKALERELAELRASKRAEAIVGTLSEAERGDIPEEYVGVAAKVATRATENAMTDVNEELARLRMEREAEKAETQRRAKEGFVMRIREKYPNFLEEIAPGGEKSRSWNAYLEHNRESVAMAFNACDFNTLAYHVDRFYREVLGVRPPAGGQGGASVPDPVTHDGGVPSDKRHSGKVYTGEEYDALDNQCMKLRRQGRFEEYRKLRDELDTALSEGRVQG